MSTTDRIEKHVTLNAARTKVWNAIVDAKLFGRWFGAEFDGPFVAGQPVTGRIVPTQVDPEVAKLQAPHAGTAMTWAIERIDPMVHFSFRWHPYAMGEDVSKEPTTLVTFELADAPNGAGTLLTIVETGFDQLPSHRRAAAYAANDGGWGKQVELIAKFVEGGAR